MPIPNLWKYPDVLNHVGQQNCSKIWRFKTLKVKLYQLFLQEWNSALNNQEIWKIKALKNFNFTVLIIVVGTKVLETTGKLTLNSIQTPSVNVQPKEIHVPLVAMEYHEMSNVVLRGKNCDLMLYGRCNRSFLLSDHWVALQNYCWAVREGVWGALIKLSFPLLWIRQQTPNQMWLSTGILFVDSPDITAVWVSAEVCMSHGIIL